MPSKVQEAGSLLSYLKRYSLADAVGAKVAELDDDAESIERPVIRAPQKAAAPSPSPAVDAAAKMRAAVAVPTSKAPPADILARKAKVMEALQADDDGGASKRLSDMIGRKVTTLEGFKFADVAELERVEKALAAFEQETLDFFEQAAAIHAEGVAAKAAKESK
jgi:hypothetical protein